MQIIKGTPTKELIEQIVADTNDKAKMEIMQFSGMDDKTLSGVFAELSNHITVFATSDDLQRALSGEGRSITPADIEGGYDIFCCIPEHKLEEWKDLFLPVPNGPGINPVPPSTIGFIVSITRTPVSNNL